MRHPAQEVVIHTDRQVLGSHDSFLPLCSPFSNSTESLLFLAQAILSLLPTTARSFSATWDALPSVVPSLSEISPLSQQPQPLPLGFRLVLSLVSYCSTLVSGSASLTK